MSRALWIAAGLAVSVVTKPAQKPPDAGGVALNVTASDGGTAAVAVAAADGGASAAPAAVVAAPSVDTVELARLRGEVELLKQRTAALEREAEVQRQQATQTQAVVQQLETLRSELQSANAAQAEKERAVATQVANGKRAVDLLMGAVSQLSTGDRNIEGALRAAESAGLTPVAQQDLAMARQSLANDDLRIATNYILQAVNDSQYAR